MPSRKSFESSGARGSSRGARGGAGRRSRPHRCGCGVGACASKIGDSAGGSLVCGAVIVHPRFRHTLDDPPVAADPPRPGDWLDLPVEVMEMIAAQLDKAQDLLSLSSVCRAARPLATSDALWKQLCQRRFGVPGEPDCGGAGSPPPRGFWLDLFKYNHRVFMHMVRCSNGSEFARFGPGPLVIRLA